MDWLDEEIKLQTSNELIPQTYMDKICVHIWHMKDKHTICKHKMMVDISGEGVISYQTIANIMKKWEYIDNIRYRPTEYFILNIDIDETRVVELGQFDVSYISNIIGKYIKPLHMYKSIVVSPSVCIFHELNCIFIIMEELKPILKSLHYTKRIRSGVDGGGSGVGGGGGSGVGVLSIGGHNKTMKTQPHK